MKVTHLLTLIIGVLLCTACLRASTPSAIDIHQFSARDTISLNTAQALIINHPYKAGRLWDISLGKRTPATLIRNDANLVEQVLFHEPGQYSLTLTSIANTRHPNVEQRSYTIEVLEEQP